LRHLCRSLRQPHRVRVISDGVCVIGAEASVSDNAGNIIENGTHISDNADECSDNISFVSDNESFILEAEPFFIAKTTFNCHSSIFLAGIKVK
jgi:hypothetical protein